MKKVSSESNPTIKEYRRLLDGKNRGDNRIAVEGFNLLEEAIKQGFEIETLFYSSELASRGHLEVLLENVPPGTRKIEVSPTLFKKISQTETPPGVAAVVEYPEFTLEQALDEVSSPAMLADRLQDPGNLGTIMRSLAAAGGRFLFYRAGTVNPFNHKVLRSSAGALFHLRLVKCDDLRELLIGLKKKGFLVVSTDLETSSYYYQVDFNQPFVLITGNERQGVSREAGESADISVKIPLAEGVESLNAAVATAVILFEARRQELTGSQGK